MASDSPHPLFPYRYALLAGYLALWIFVAVATCSYDWLIGGQLSILQFSLVAAIIIALQMLFLVGAPHLRLRKATGGRPMMVSLAVGALFAALLSTGVVATSISLFQPLAAEFRDLANLLLCVTLASWLGWIFIFAWLIVGDWADRYRRLYRILLAGTVLELLITIPVDVSVRRRTNCYCDEGTFYAFLAGLMAMLWVLGPGIVLLFLARRVQRRRHIGCCRQCGYDLRMLTTARCPECGSAFELPPLSRIPQP